MAIQFYDNVKLGDNNKLLLGESSDLQIYHDGSHSRIKDSGVGSLTINATDFIVNNSADTKNMIIAVDGGATTLFCNGTGRLATTSTGVSVTGNGIFSGDVLVEDNLYLTDAGTVRGKIQLSSSDRDDLDIKAISLGSLMRFYTADTLALTLDASQKATFAGTVNIVGTNTTGQESVLLRGITANGNDLLGSIRTANTGSYNQEMRFYTSNASGSSDEDLTLTLKPDQSATFAGNVNVGGDATFNAGVVKKGSGGYYLQTSGGAFRAAFWDNGGETAIFADGNGSTAALVINDNNTTFAGNVSLGDGKLLKLGASDDYQIYHNSTTNVNHIFSDLDRQLSINANIIQLTNQANSTTYLKLESSGATFAGDVTISKSTPKLTFNNLAGGGLDPSLTASGTNFTISTSSITPLSLALDTGNATFAGDVMPAAENAHNIGSASVRWEDLYVDDGFIRNAYIDDYINHNGDADTYFGFPTDNEFKLVVGGSNKFAADANAAYLYYQGNAKLQTTSTGIEVSGNVNADSFIKDGGTSSQYLMADGSVSSGPSGGISEVVAGTNLTGGGTASTVTLNMATGGIGAGDYGSNNNGLKIDKISVDAYGRITAITTGLTGSGNGDITAVNTSSGSGLSGGSTSGSVSLSIDMTGTDNYISAASSTLTSADSGDLIPIVDISSSNTVKKITAANLVGAGGGVTSTTSGEPSGSSTITNIVQIDLTDYNTAAGNGNLVNGTVYLIK